MNFLLYRQHLTNALQQLSHEKVERLSNEIHKTHVAGGTVFVCGNGGSAANAEHFVNDLTYGVYKTFGKGINTEALTSNSSTLTCLANDLGYAEIFAHQLSVKSKPGDLLIVLSGSGRSPNVLRALEQAKKHQIKSYAIVGFDGGSTIHLADNVLHTAIHDMQICEDLQLIILHAVTKQLCVLVQQTSSRENVVVN